MKKLSYQWGTENKATVLADELIFIKKEIIQPYSGETWHFHKKIIQWFLPLKGDLTVETPEARYHLSVEECIKIHPLTAHKVWNDTAQPAEFYLISSENAKDDKYFLEYKYPAIKNLKLKHEPFQITYIKSAHSHFNKVFSKFKDQLIEFLPSENDLKSDFRSNAFSIFYEEQLTGYIFLRNSNNNTCEVTFCMENPTAREAELLFIQFILKLILDFGYRNLNIHVKNENIDFINIFSGTGFIKKAISDQSIIIAVDAKSFIPKMTSIEILKHNPGRSPYFKRLNEEWIGEYFEIEEADKQVLNFPQEKIITPGGEIFYLSLNGEIISTGALMPLADGAFELTKMATTKKYQGLGFGDLIMQEAIKWCRKNNIKSIVLYTQSTLFKALKLYEKHGFRKEELNQTLYKRADVKMRLML